ncbi:MAG: hypothetical protein GSR85_06965 [Desulfurococcales archaeon]|nr:hypothetical protein [Desulfurococcales archaeon]
MLGRLSPSAYQTFILILRYLASKNSSTYCFTYKGLRAWLAYNRDAELRKLEWHTIERSIRALAEMEVLRRVQKGRRVVFCPGRHFFQLKYEYQRILEDANAEANQEFKELLEYLAGPDPF